MRKLRVREGERVRVRGREINREMGSNLLLFSGEKNREIERRGMSETDRKKKKTIEREKDSETERE